MMKDRRLIEALDYIDDEYIASAALYKMRAEAERARPLAQTAGQSIKKHWKHYLGFAACLLVLALATPLFTHLPEIINSFAAGWGEGSEETTENLNTHLTEPINTDPYSINQAELDQINAAWAKYTNNQDVLYCSNPADIHYLTGDQYCFYGKYNGCIVLYYFSALPRYSEYEIHGYLFRIPCGKLWVCRYGEPYNLSSAYKNGWLSDNDIEEIWKRHNENAWNHSWDH
jgi:hypothetical protein